MKYLIRAYIGFGFICFSLTSALGQGSYHPLEIVGASDSKLELVAKGFAGLREIPVLLYLPESHLPAPVILFSHGLGGSRHHSAYLGKHWSARGYIAVFVQHTGSDESVWQGLPLKDRMPALKNAAGVKNFFLRINDISNVIDQLESWNKNHSKLKERMKLSKIGMSGHSFGAITTQAVSGQEIAQGILPITDDRIKAALIMSPSSPQRGNVDDAFGKVSVPWMLMTGTHDIAAVGASNMKSRLAVFPALPAGGKYELVLHDAEHSVFTERTLPGDSKQRNPNHHRIILALSTAFWDTWLLGDIAARTWLEGSGPHSVLEENDKWQLK